MKDKALVVTLAESKKDWSKSNKGSFFMANEKEIKEPKVEKWFKKWHKRYVTCNISNSESDYMIQK